MKYESNAEYCRRKADQHYEMAGLARMDNDKVDELRHLKLAKAWEEQRASFFDQFNGLVS